jgi:hypothetical protein
VESLNVWWELGWLAGYAMLRCAGALMESKGILREKGGLYTFSVPLRR